MVSMQSTVKYYLLQDPVRIIQAPVSWCKVCEGFELRIPAAVTDP